MNKMFDGGKSRGLVENKKPIEREEGLYCLKKDRPDYPQPPGCHYVMGALCELFKHTFGDTPTHTQTYKLQINGRHHH